MNIYVIAELAKVSPSTVSKVINGREGVGEQTRNKVLKIVREHDFKPRVSSNKPNNIAVLIRPEENVFDSEFIRKILKGLTDNIFEHNSNLLLLPNYKIPRDKASFRVFCHEQRIIGCIFLNLKTDDTFITDIAGVVPIVTVNAKFKGENVFSLCSDDFNGAYSAMQFFYDMGHRKIALMALDLLFKSHQERYQAYMQALEDFGIPFDKDYVINAAKFSFSNFRFLIENLEESGKLPTAILVTNDQEAIRLISYLKNLGKHVPEDISIIGFDDYDFDEHITPPLTTVKQELYEMGKKAANIIIDATTRKTRFDSENCDYVYGTELMPRRSVKRITE